VHYPSRCTPFDVFRSCQHLCARLPKRTSGR
jgi:hypothetical protein